MAGARGRNISHSYAFCIHHRFPCSVNISADLILSTVWQMNFHLPHFVDGEAGTYRFYAAFSCSGWRMELLWKVSFNPQVAHSCCAIPSVVLVPTVALFQGKQYCQTQSMCVLLEQLLLGFFWVLCFYVPQMVRTTAEQRKSTQAYVGEPMTSVGCLRRNTGKG